MATRLFRVFTSDLTAVKRHGVRYGHRMRGKPPGIARTLQQRLDELNYVDPVLAARVDIGLPNPIIDRKKSAAAQMAHIRAQKSDPNLEKKARNKELLIDLEETRKDWLENTGPFHIRKIAEHYGVYKDLFGDAYFNPHVPMEIDYDIGQNDAIARVYNGNMIRPIEASQAPTVSFEADPDTLWTLLLTCPDGNLIDANNEYCHWFIGNIPGNDLGKGEQLVDYLRPIPTRGTGYHRYIFVLYKQDKRIDYSSLKKNQPCLALKERNWNTLDFYRERQDYLTPAGLSFFQAEWDPSLTDFYHSTLQMKEPVFEYDFPEPYIRPQTWFPLRLPFNLYMDKYRDPKDVNKDYLLKKLKKVHPFKEPEPPLKFPNAHPLHERIPSWLKLEIRKDRLRWGRINDIE